MSQKEQKFNSMGLEIAGMRKQSLGAGAKGFEMYGIGAKMLAGMGFQPGKGLGKDLQGISAPIEAHVRKGRGAIGTRFTLNKSFFVPTKKNWAITGAITLSNILVICYRSIWKGKKDCSCFRTSFSPA